MREDGQLDRRPHNQFLNESADNLGLDAQYDIDRDLAPWGNAPFRHGRRGRKKLRS